MSEWDGRGNNFDFMRLSLAVLVIYSHAYALGLGSEAAEPVVRFTHGQVSGGVIAVDGFFVMSGFLIAASAQRSRSIRGFLKKRCARIYPAFVFSGLARGWDFVWRTLWLTEFSYAGVFARNPFPDVINGSTWSVPYEFWCYIGLALLSLAGLLRRRGIVLGLFVALWGLSFLFRWRGWILGGKELGLIFGPPQIWARMLPLYLAGVVFYLYRDRIPLRDWIAAISLAALIAASWFYTGWTVVFPLAGTYLLFWFAFTPRVRLHRFGRFGDFSYGAYLYAFPVEQLVVQGLGRVVAPWVVFAWSTPITLALAVASWYGVERHFLAPARRKEALTHAAVSSVS
jgi:peptidoglycan/LPS O-acetylase OafA/YrhL